MRWLYAVCLFVLLPPAFTSAAEPPVDQEGRPQIKKLGTIDVDKVENAPVVLREKLRSSFFAAGSPSGDTHPGGVRCR
jgi:hypothetical protein